MDIKLKNVSKIYKNNDKYILNEINATFKLGINFLSGDNGSGKTTLLNILYKEDLDYTGQISIDNQQLNSLNVFDYRSNICSYITQDSHIYEDLSLIENVNVLNTVYSEEYFNTLLIKLNMNDFVRKKYKKLSGGQKQKSKIILALLKDTPILLIDEIENNLDEANINFVYNHLQELNKTIIFITHNSIQEIKKIIGNKKFNYYNLIDNKIVHENIFVQENLQKLEYDKNKNGNLNPLNKKFVFPIMFLLILIYLSFNIMLPVFDNLHFDVFQTGIFEDGWEMYDDDVLVIYTPIHSEQIYTYGTEEALEKHPFFFRKQELEYLEENEFLEEVKPVTTSGNSIGLAAPNKEKGTFESSKDLDLSKIDFNKYNLDVDEYINPEFKIYWYDPILPKEDILSLHYNIENIILEEVLFGEMPDDNTNEVMLDMYSASYYAQELNLSNLEDLIGKEIIVETCNSYPEDYPDNLPRNNDFSGETNLVVSGIFEPINAEEGYAIKSYHDDTFSLEMMQLWKYDEEDAIDETLLQTSYTYEILGIDMPDVNDVREDGGYYFPGFYIRLKEAENMEKAINAIKDYDPYIDINSNYSNSNERNWIYVRDRLFMNILKMLILIILNVVAMVLLFRYFFIVCEDITSILKFYGIRGNNYISKINIITLVIMFLEIFTLILFRRYFRILLIFNIYFILVTFILYIVQFIKFRRNFEK